MGSDYTTENSNATGIIVGWTIALSNPYNVAYFLTQARQDQNSLEKWLRKSQVNKRENYKVITKKKCLSLYLKLFYSLV